MYEGFEIPEEIKEVVSYSGLEYYHFKLLSYLNERFSKTTTFIGIFTDQTEFNKVIGEMEEIPDGAVTIIKEDMIIDGKKVPSGSILMYDGTEWVIINDFKVDEDAVWAPIGEGVSYRSVFKLPANSSAVIAFTKVENETIVNDLLFVNTNYPVSKKNLVTLMTDFFASYEIGDGNVVIGTSRMWGDSGVEVKFKILFATCDKDDILFFNEDENGLTLTSSAVKTDNIVIHNSDDVVIDPTSATFTTIVVIESGEADLNLKDYNQILLDTSAVDSSVKLDLNVDDYLPNVSNIIEITDKVDGLKLDVDGHTVIDIDEPLYGGDKVVVEANMDEEGNITWAYKLYTSNFKSSDNSIKIKKLDDGGFDFTTSISEKDLEGVERVANKTNEVDSTNPSTEKYVSEAGLVKFMTENPGLSSTCRKVRSSFVSGQSVKYFLMDVISAGEDGQIDYSAVYAITPNGDNLRTAGLYQLSVKKGKDASKNGYEGALVKLSGLKDDMGAIFAAYDTATGNFNVYVRQSFPKTDVAWEEYLKQFGADPDYTNKNIGVSLYIIEEEIKNGDIERKVEFGKETSTSSIPHGTSIAYIDDNIYDVKVDGNSVVDANVANITLPESPDFSLYQLKSNMVDEINELNKQSTTQYASNAALTDFIDNILKINKLSKPELNFGLNASQFVFNRDYYFVLGVIEPLSHEAVTIGNKIGNYTYEPNTEYVTEDNATFTTYIESPITESSSLDVLDYSTTFVLESDYGNYGLYRFHIKTDGGATGTYWSDIYNLNNVENPNLKPFIKADTANQTFYFGFKVEGWSEEDYATYLASFHGRVSSTVNYWKGNGGKAFIIEESLNAGRLYRICNMSTDASKFVMRSVWDNSKLSILSFTDANVIDNYIKDVKVDGVSVVEDNVAKITMPDPIDTSSFQLVSLCVSAFNDEDKTSTIKYASLNYVNEVVQKAKSELKTISCGNSSTGGLWNLIRVESDGSKGTACGPYYRTTFMVYGGSQNADFFGLCELTFGFNRDTSSSSVAYKYCVPKWIAFTKGDIHRLGDLELKVFTSSDYKTLYVAGRTPSAYTYMNLSFLSEFSEKATVSYPTTISLETSERNLINVPITFMNQMELTEDQVVAIRAKLGLS